MRFPRLSREWWKTWGDPICLVLAVALFAIQELAISYIDPEGASAWLRRSVFFIATPLFVFVTLHFRRYIGAWVIAIGITLNFVPMALHGGNMPVAYEIVRDSGAFPDLDESVIGGQIGNSKDVVLWKEDIRAYPLSDNITYTLPGYRTNIYSPGDVVIGIGVLIAAVEIIAAAFGFSVSSSLARRFSRQQSVAR